MEAEELSLKQGLESKRKGQPGQPQPAAPEARPQTVKEILRPGMTNEEIVSALISMPEEKLIPWEMCDLPSGGRYYKDQFNNAWPDGYVQVRAMTQTAEKVLATARLADSGQSIDYLLRECVRLPDNFDPCDLLITDRTFLLYYIRGITHGNMYEFAVECPDEDCKQKSIHEYDLNLLAGTIKRPDIMLDEPFKVVLPYASELAGKEVWVHVRHLRGIDIQNVMNLRKVRKRSVVSPGRSKNPFQRRAEQMKQQVQLDQTLTEVMEKNIVSIMGVTNQQVIATFVSKLHARDSGTIREWLRENTPGIDTTINLDCPHCGNNFTVELPVSETFFRPSTQRGA